MNDRVERVRSGFHIFFHFKKACFSTIQRD